MQAYRHSQFGKMFIVLLLILEAWMLAVFSFSFINDGLELLWLLISFETVFAILFVLFFQLNVVIDDRHLRIAFGVGLIRKQWSLEDLQGAQPVENSWWYGFGIRLTPHGWLYNIDGLKAVEFQKTDGSTFRVGTDEPETLIAAFAVAKRGT